MSSIFFNPILQLIAGDGSVIPSGELYFYVSGSTTPTSVYHDYDRTTAWAQPVEADIDGVFPQVFLDPAVQYRLKVCDEDHDTASPLFDRDPINEAAADLSHDEVIAALGYTPLSTAGGNVTGQLHLTEDQVADLTGDEAGYRINPYEAVETDFTFWIRHAQKMLVHVGSTDHTWHIEAFADEAIPAGWYCIIIQYGTGNITLARAAGVQLRQVGSATDADVVITDQYLRKVLQKVDTDSWLLA
jgi:hypothetical protein